MKRNREISRPNTALHGFKRLMLYLLVSATLMVGAALVYLSSTGALTPTLVITVTVGVFVSIMLGGGLMAAGFFSAHSGHDDDVASASVQPLTDTPKPDT